ncbi:MAG TPA: hypothetical protein DDW51_05480 [Cyanobacteria bacterium UBA11367]|nr:hypothetical protein [Cyanobacteria bacterium UBA11367]HBE56783.1 hypothetical protein [Cyanobacteria bacterium UBA11366]
MYWEKYYLDTKNADWKIFWWAITKNDIQKCRITLQCPIGILNNPHNRIRYFYFQFPVRIDIPYFLIRYRAQTLGNKDWDNPFPPRSSL